MTISQTQLAQALSEAEIDKFWLGYFQEGFREEIHQKLLEHYEMLKGTIGLTRADLAKKIGRRPEQVTRWLTAPTNLESDTISDLGIGMGLVPRLSFEPIENLFISERANRGNEVSDFVGRVRVTLEAEAANGNVSYTPPKYTAAASS